jgi:hypothetical protein
MSSIDTRGESARKRGEAEILRLLEAAPYAKGSREEMHYVKGLVIAAGNALARCKFTGSGAPSAAARTLRDRGAG